MTGDHVPCTALVMGDLYVGIDLGTSGCRAAAIDDRGRPVEQAAVPMPPPRRNGVEIDQDPAIWWSAAKTALLALLDGIERPSVRAIAVDGTSGTLLLTDGVGEPLTPGLMYNDTRAGAEALRIKSMAPPESGALGASSALAKLLHLTGSGAIGHAVHALHQADWIQAQLSGCFGLSDQNNALKLGYDVIADQWPDWICRLGLSMDLLPNVLAPGSQIGPIARDQADAFGLPPETSIVAGTTDGVAAFLATGASELGDAVTSLGSTLVVKQLADRPLFDPVSGIYSHRLGDLWLPGGASNSGGEAIARFFSAEVIEQLTPKLLPDRPTGLDYYPLPGTGERFPVSDPKKPSVTEPRPESDALFLQGLLEGIASIEALAYKKLQTLGAPVLRSVRTVGGGAANHAWTAIRGAKLGVAVSVPDRTEAAFGAARLARMPYAEKGNPA